MKVSLIIAAGGAGKRFLKGQRTKPTRASKLFLNLGEKPVLRHALDSFQGIPQIKEAVLAVPAGTEKWVKAHVADKAKIPVRLVRGGATRAESVWKALRSTSPKNSWVLVHDGARPFPPKKAVIGLLKTNGAEGALLARPVVPTLKRAASGKGHVLETVDRQNLYEAETPQLVRRDFLLKAYQKNPRAFSATDESSLVESMGGKMKIVDHSGWNVKITTPEDLRLAEAYYTRHCEPAAVLGGRSNPEAQRLLRPRQSTVAGPRNDSDLVTVGFGRDTHRLVPGRKFYLGGIRIPFEKGSLGHSDGDVLLHAICDALLGAAGMGDIGDWFPPGNSRFKNLRSEKFVKKILEALRKKGWQPDRVDTVTLLEKPKLTPYKLKMRKKISRILGIPADHVSIKAKTQEGLGPEGEGRAVTCEALAILRRIS